MNDVATFSSDEEELDGTSGMDSSDPIYFELEPNLEGDLSTTFPAQKSKDANISSVLIIGVLESRARNKPGQKQRVQVSSFSPGFRRRPEFSVSCTARTMVHGTIDDINNERASLLVYDFTFFSLKSHIREARVDFEFQPNKSTSGGPSVKTISPCAEHILLPTSQTVTNSISGEAGIGSALPVNLEAKFSSERSVEKSTTHSASIVGDRPSDDWGSYFRATWNIKENDSQNGGVYQGVPRSLRTCILLTRDSDEDFRMLPSIEVQSDFGATLKTLFYKRPADDPVIFDTALEPYNTLEGLENVDRWNLGNVSLKDLWGWTYHETFERSFKAS